MAIRRRTRIWWRCTTHAQSPESELVSQLKAALSIEHSRLHDATKPIDEDVLRAEFEARHSCTYGFKRSHRGTYSNPPTATRWNSFRLGAEVARALR